MSLPAPPLRITEPQREILEMWARSRALPQRQVLRASIILLAAEGMANEVIAESLGTSKPSVLKWRVRFEANGIEGLEEAGGRGPKPTYGRKFVEKVVSTTLRQPPPGVTHWSTRSLAEHLGTSHDTIHRIWRDNGLRPHRVRGFK